MSKTRAIILAAGEGKRLKKYTRDLPKGMLPFLGRPLIAHQIDRFREQGIDTIGIVTGYQAGTIPFPEVRKFHNPRFAETNMVESLMCASEMLSGDVVISYADILVENRVLRGLLDFPADIAVTVDLAWQDYWKARYGSLNCDTESLVMDPNGDIVTLGLPTTDLNNIHGRYVGLLKFSAKGMDHLKRVYQEARKTFWGKPWKSSPSFQQGYMTDLLQACIDAGQTVRAFPIEKGWLEFDTDTDYETYLSWQNQGTLGRFIHLSPHDRAS